MNRTMTLAAAVLCALLQPGGAVVASGQAGTPESPDPLNERGPRAGLMLVGAFHFDYPELDVVKSTSRLDVLEAERQREVAVLVERLAAWAPTRVAVEARVERQARLDSLYREYLAGRLELPRGEAYQVGFRLAKRLGHARVYAVDTERADVLLELARSQLEPREAELMATDPEWRERFARFRAHEDSVNALRRRSLIEMFVAMNEPEAIRRSHLPYSVGFFKFDGEEGGYAGADFIAGWYDRNLRIFRNLQRITAGPEDRVLLLIGSGHLPILRFVAAHSPEYRLVEPNDYLAGEPAGPTR